MVLNDKILQKQLLIYQRDWTLIATFLQLLLFNNNTGFWFRRLTRLIWFKKTYQEQEHSESADLWKRSPLPPYFLDFWLGESTWRSKSLQNLVNFFLYYCRAIPKIPSKSTNNFLSSGQRFNWTVSMVIELTTKNLINCSLYHYRSLLKIP